MKLLIYLGHPAHYHLFKNSIDYFKKQEHDVFILIKKKDILENLLKNDGREYFNILPKGRKDNTLSILMGIVKRDFRLFTFCLKHHPDILMGTSAEIGHVGSILNIPSINFNEDDASVVPKFATISYPWNTLILSPDVCYNGKWEKKSIKYNSYHELAYLHPDNFKASRDIADKYVNTSETFFIIRFAELKAHHDKGISGITNDLAMDIIEILQRHGKVYMTSERELPDYFEKFRLSIDPVDIHHVLSFASLYIGDSQTMAAESGVLGVPFVRYNDFVGKIGYLEDIENKYKLGFGIKPPNSNLLLNKIEYLLNLENRNKIFIDRKNNMLKDKIDFTKFINNFIVTYYNKNLK